MNYISKSTKTEPFKIAKRKKRIAMFFSGGLDSTYLLYKNLKEGHKVTPFYVEISNNIDKCKIEKQQIVKIYNILCQEITDNNLVQPQIISKLEILKHYDNDLKFVQIPIWLFVTNYIAQHKYDEIQIGYIANDDSIPYVEDIKKTYKSMNWLFHDSSHRPKLTFPLLKYTKRDMLDVLPPSILELVYSCETPFLGDDLVNLSDVEKSSSYGLREEFLSNPEHYQTFEPCGYCDPCKKILGNEFLYKSYIYHQPIFKKLKVNRVYEEYENIKNLVKFNPLYSNLTDKIDTDTKEEGWIDVKEKRQTESTLTNFEKTVSMTVRASER